MPGRDLASAVLLSDPVTPLRRHELRRSDSHELVRKPPREREPYIEQHSRDCFLGGPLELGPAREIPEFGREEIYGDDCLVVEAVHKVIAVGSGFRFRPAVEGRDHGVPDGSLLQR